MGAWQVTCAWAPVSQFLPHNSATLQFQVLMSMQMDVYLKKEQIGTLFVLVGALKGGFRGVQPKDHTNLRNFFFWSLLPNASNSFL